MRKQTCQCDRQIKKKNLDFHAVVSTYEDLYIHASIVTDIDEARVISFLGVRTDIQTRFWNPHNYGNMSAHKIFNSKAQD